LSPFLNPSLPGRDAWKHGAIPVIGLIGGIGAGKSQVASLLRERGAVVIDADAVGHEILNLPEVRRRVIRRFGPEIAGDDGNGPIDRRALGSRVFADPAALADLETILHPRMRAQFEAIIGREARAGGASAIVLDAAILLEAGWDDLCDLVVYVDAAFPVRLGRVSQARGWTAETLLSREAAQRSRDEKIRRADIVLTNDQSLTELEQAVARFSRSLRLTVPRESERPLSGSPSDGQPLPFSVGSS
jgi:dephospho-CoA kinase